MGVCAAGMVGLEGVAGIGWGPEMKGPRKLLPLREKRRDVVTVSYGRCVRSRGGRPGSFVWFCEGTRSPLPLQGAATVGLTSAEAPAVSPRLPTGSRGSATHRAAQQPHQGPTLWATAPCQPRW